MASPSLSVRAAILVVLACVGSCGSDEPQGPKGAGTPPNVLLLVVDTLRADHLGAYGAARSVPGIDRLAREGVTVEGLRASTSWTMPSMATLFTGLTPAEHRVMRMEGLGSQLLEPRTLAAEFRRAGYATGCIMTNFLMLAGRGFDEGFDLFDTRLVNLLEPHRGSTAAQVADLGIAWLENPSKSNPNQAGADEAGQQPWMLTLHFFDPHTSYEDHPEHAFTDPDYLGWVRGGLSNADYKANQASSGPADLAQLRALYDEEVHAVGRAIDRVLIELEKRGELKNTLVVFTADHGEELAERGYIGHTRTLHFEQVNLPFIVRLPNGAQAGQRRRGLMQQTDLFASLLDLAGLESKLERGQSRAAWLRTGRPAVPLDTQAFYEVDFEPIVDDPAKRIHQRGVERRDPSGELLGKYVINLKTGDEFLWTDEAERVNQIKVTRQASLLADLRAAVASHRWYTP
jgi:arylsulfatase A-like enzyme